MKITPATISLSVSNFISVPLRAYRAQYKHKRVVVPRKCYKSTEVLSHVLRFYAINFYAGAMRQRLDCIQRTKKADRNSARFLFVWLWLVLQFKHEAEVASVYNAQAAWRKVLRNFDAFINSPAVALNLFVY